MCMFQGFELGATLRDTGLKNGHLVTLYHLLYHFPSNPSLTSFPGDILIIDENSNIREAKSRMMMMYSNRCVLH